MAGGRVVEPLRIEGLGAYIVYSSGLYSFDLNSYGPGECGLHARADYLHSRGLNRYGHMLGPTAHIVMAMQLWPI